MMNHSASILLMVAAAVFGGVWYFAGGNGQGTEPSAAVVGPDRANAPVKAPTSATVPVAGPASIPAADVSRWIVQAHGGDPVRRGAAIAALANAPRSQALPVLHQILINGEPGTDRALALRSLRELALEQGDTDGKVRDAIREVIYHGDGQDENLLANAQDTLDVVEESELR